MKGDAGRFEVADSGDEEGEGSIIRGESKVEFVVVGEDSVEAEVMEVTLSRWCKDWADLFKESGGGFASVTSSWVSLLIVSRVGASSISFGSIASAFPTTDMNDGKGVDIIEQTSLGMFGYLGVTVRLFVDGATSSESDRATEKAVEI